MGDRLSDYHRPATGASGAPRNPASCAGVPETQMPGTSPGMEALWRKGHPQWATFFQIFFLVK
ncbi:hypothetical protein GCM10007301_08060 [Azorhizobium oxalatiphilum]|uniref:Uncharacterized protein n=1 Tax=Azorhizobium oxalatiphilum TaxID=980631 RepID=A0A917BMV0_9HYPH|nr:hypothetical protein GCM10007301_08060 [Azorhizobium oxalatiphilum]